MSMLPQDAHVPRAMDRLPCTFSNVLARCSGYASIMVMALSSIFILPIISFDSLIPSMLLFDYIKIPSVGWWAVSAIVSVPAAIIYMILVFVELIVLRWLVLGTVVECSFRTTSVYFYRKWLIDRLMDMGFVTLRPVYATLYAVLFLRSLGVKIGSRAEVSTARGINFEFTEIGYEYLIADRVVIGDKELPRNMVTLKKTKLNKRVFLGNVSLVPQGTELASNNLLGVMSCVPEIPLKEGRSFFGSPPVCHRHSAA
jgi:non-ribosomal peptide synthetase-like protein